MSALRIAERWYEITRGNDGVTHITEPYVHAVWRSNIWHVRGRDADMLVDSGMGITPLREAIAHLIEPLFRSLPGGFSEVVTHGAAVAVARDALAADLDADPEPRMPTLRSASRLSRKARAMRAVSASVCW